MREIFINKDSAFTEELLKKETLEREELDKLLAEEKLRHPEPVKS